MSTIYWNLKEIPIPEDAKRNAYDNQVSIYYKDWQGNRRRHVIGRAVTEKTMHPNSNFRFFYPALWREYYSEDANLQHEKHFGLYALHLGAGYGCGIYPLMHEDFGPESANAMMDYSMYTIDSRSSTTQLIQNSLYEQVLFSRCAWSDSWYSSFFSHKISAERIHAFKMHWLQQCADRGIRKVWLCVDGSNDDCLMQNSSLAAPGPAKSGKNVNIVSYIWAVEAETGRPVTWFVNSGGTHDVKAFPEIIKFLALSNIEVEGVILDRGFVSQDTLDLIEDLGLKFIMMLKTTTNGYCEMMLRHASKIHWQVRHVLQSHRNGLFGIVDKVKLFRSSPTEHYVGLFFDAKNGSTRSIHSIDKVLDEADRLRQILAENPNTNAVVEPKFRKYLSIERSGQKPEVSFDFDTWQRDVDSKGFSAIASSEQYSADELSKRYSMRQASETQFSLLKSQLNGNVIRVHSDAALESRFLCFFISAVLRTEIMLSCQSHQLDINDVLSKANSLRMVLMPDFQYHSVDGYSKQVLTVLNDFGILKEHFNTFLQEVNAAHCEQLFGSSLKQLPANKEPEVPKRRPGRPKGSKNKSTLAREAAEAAKKEAQADAPKRGPGRPKGSKNKSTLVREAAEAAKKEAQADAPKRGPSRPKGSKNKSTLVREAAEAAKKEAQAEVPKSAPDHPNGSNVESNTERDEQRLSHTTARKTGYDSRSSSRLT